MSRALWVLGSAVVLGMVALLWALRASAPTPTPVATSDDGGRSDAPALPRPTTRPGALPRPDPAPAAVGEVDADVDVDEDAPPPRTLDDEGRLVADHRGEEPPERAPLLVSGRQAIAVRRQVQPDIEACLDALSDPAAAAGASISVSTVVEVEAGAYTLREPRVVSRGLSDRPFFACVEDRLDGLSMPIPGAESGGQPQTGAQRVTFPYRVP